MPHRLMEGPPPPADFRLCYGNHPSQFADFRRSSVAGRRPLAIMIHGGFWRARVNLTYAGHLCRALGDAGFGTANLEYRRVGEEGGGWPGTFDDIRRAIRFAREHAGDIDSDPECTVVLGHSAGGHLALWAAAEIPDLRGVISLGGVASLRSAWELHLSNDAVVELMGGTPAEFPDRYRIGDPEQRPCFVPRVLVHGSADETVPVEIARGFPLSAKLVEIPNGDHFGLIDPASADIQFTLAETCTLT
jgi:acetyl esterase/lipase